MKVVVLRLRVLLLAVVMIAAVVLAAFAAGSAQAQEVYWSGRRSLPIYSVGREDNAIAITFDCAWGTEYTQSLLDTLSERGVRATFFAVQFWTEKYPDCVRSIDAAGMELGTHSATHSYMSKQSEEEIRGELKSSAQAITQITGKAVTLFLRTLPRHLLHQLRAGGQNRKYDHLHPVGYHQLRGNLHH